MTLLKTTLDNGIKVLVLDKPTAPIVSVWVWYRVGSRNEHLGKTGISHWTEHMAFQGTENWPRGKADMAVSREGGTFNGMTWLDFTTYYESLPIERIDLALDIESDRMQFCRFAPDAVEGERSVILSERAGQENSPLFRLGEQVTAAAFTVHPYRYEVVGHVCDLQAITHKDLEQHYQTYYTPQNATIAIAGAVGDETVLQKVERYFSHIKSNRQPPVVTAVEPQQRGERRVTVEGVGQTNYLEIAYHIPPGNHKDYYALTVLNALLTGGSGFLVGRGSMTNHTSRLYRALVDAEQALDISGHMLPTIDPGLFRLTATAWPGKKGSDLENALWAELDHLANEAVSPDELKKAHQQARALFAYASESITYQAFWLGFTEQFASYDWYNQFLDNITSVTAEDILSAVQTYLQPSNRTVGWYLGQAAAF